MPTVEQSKAPMTLESFKEELKALLQEAEDNGLDPEHLCQIAETVIETGWR